jgi:hypothetical protein
MQLVRKLDDKFSIMFHPMKERYYVATYISPSEYTFSLNHPFKTIDDAVDYAARLAK